VKYLVQVISFLFLLSPFSGYAQHKKEAKSDQVAMEASVDTLLWKRQLYRALINITDSLQIEEILPPGRYTILFEFSVNEDGSVSNFSCKKDPGYGILPLLEIYVRRFPIIWKPETRDGVPVISRLKQTVFIETFAE